MLSQLPDYARVWIYQADRPLNDYEVVELQGALNQFTANWTAHTMQLAAAAEIRHNQFVIIGVDETVNPASGCSIDASVRLMKTYETKFQIDFFNRLNIAFLKNETLTTIKLSEMNQAVADGTINPETICFNNLVNTVAELKTEWQQTMQQTWLKKYFSELC